MKTCSENQPARVASFGLTLLTVLLTVLPGCQRGNSSPVSEGPNIILLVVDTLRADRLGCYGSSPSPSGNLDALASEGVLFRSAYSQSSWTRPSFASFLTGLVPRATGIQREEGDALHPRYETLAEHLQGAGYTTLGLTANPNVNRIFGFAQGFDRYLDSKVVFDWMEAGPGQEQALQSPIQSADELLGSALTMIDGCQGGPIYLQVDLMEVHEYHGLKDPAHELMGLGARERSRRYNAAISKVDESIGRFLTELRAKPGFEKAVVIVTSDHGEGLDDHPDVQGAIGHGFVVYTSQAHVPLLIADGPGPLPDHRSIDAPVRLLDLFPTILELAGVDIPRGIEGRSLLPLVSDNEAPPNSPRSIVVETHFRGSNKLALYEPGWSLVLNRDRHPGTAPVELYRSGMVEDGSANSLAPREKQRAHELFEKLNAWEEANPVVESWQPAGGIPEDIQDQLKGVGY